MNGIMAALRSGIAPTVVHSMVDVASTALRLTGPTPTPVSVPRPLTIPADALHPHSQPRQASRSQPATADSPQQHSQQDRHASHKAGRSAAGSKSGAGSMPHTSQAATGAAAHASHKAAAGADHSHATPGPEAPYSFRRHRRMDLQPQPPAIPLHLSSSSALPATSQLAKSSPRIKLKRPSSVEAPAADTAAELAVPVRASVRVKLRRSASGNRQPASSNDVSAKQLANGHTHPPRRHPAEGLLEEDNEAGQQANAAAAMQSGSGAHNTLHLRSERSAWQSEGEQQLDEVDSARAVTGQMAGDAVSGPSNSLEQSEPDIDAQEEASQDAFGYGTEAVHQGFAAASGSASEDEVPPGGAELIESHWDEQPASQSM